MRYYSRKSGKSLMEMENLIKEIATYPLEEPPWARYVATESLTAEDIYKLIREGIQKYENEYGFSPGKIVIDSSAFHVLEALVGKVMRQTGSLEFYGIPCEVKSLPDEQVALILR